MEDVVPAEQGQVSPRTQWVKNGSDFLTTTLTEAGILAGQCDILSWTIRKATFCEDYAR